MNIRMKFIALGLLVSLGGVPQALAEEIATGNTYEVLREHDASLLPGVTKIVESIFIMQPGTKMDFPASPSMNICTSMLGAGDQWTEPKGATMTVHNTGNVPYVDKTFEIFYD